MNPAQKEIAIKHLETEQQKDLEQLRSIVSFNLEHPDMMSEKQLDQRQKLCFQLFTREEDLRLLRSNKKTEPFYTDLDMVLNHAIDQLQKVTKDPEVQKNVNFIKGGEK